MNTNIDLKGNWRYELDEDDKGIAQKWFDRTLSMDGFMVPGTTASNQLGHPVILEEKLTKETVRCLREKYKYVGACWYQRKICVDTLHQGKKVQLFLERVMVESQVWIDGIYVGRQDSLSTSHDYDITKYITFGKEQVLSIRVDNRDIPKIGPYPSAYTDETQTIWNGMVGRTQLRIQDAYEIKNLVVGVDLDRRKIDLKFHVFGHLAKEETIRLDVKIKDRVKENGVILTSRDHRIDMSDAVTKVEIGMPLVDGIQLWDEFHPVRYELEIAITDNRDGETKTTTVTKEIGFRQIDTKGGILRINGIQRFLRGNIDCCVYPNTGYPPMEVDEWDEIFTRTKNYGLNHVRFHSWCPPEAAFIAADRIGMYLQIEGPVWMDNWMGFPVGCREEHYTYLPEEAERIIDAYASHPSFCIFSNGNELNGDFDLLENILKRARQRNPYLLYTSTTNWDRKVNQQDDLFIAQSADGVGIRGQYFLDSLAEGTMLEFSEGTKKRNIPMISHEVGQYVVYPNVNEIPKYQGALNPVNLKVIKKDLEKMHLQKFTSDFVSASGKLAWLLYKAEMEAALRTKNFGGIQLLGLHDFPGQSTATIGILDCFFDSKGLGAEEEFREFCDDRVVLVNMPKRTYTTKERFEAEVQIANYGEAPLTNVEIIVRFEDMTKKELWSTTFVVEEIPVGLYSGNLHINTDFFHRLTGRTPIVISAGMINDKIEKWNHWEIGVYEDRSEGMTSLENVHSVPRYDNLTQEAVQRLKDGENILLLPKVNNIKEIGPGNFFPVFWSPVHFTSKDACGMMIDTEHPLFHKYFPSKNYADFEWKKLLESGASINLDSVSDFQPITMFVPNFYNNHKFSNIFEAKVLNGKVFVCCIDIETAKPKEIEVDYLEWAIMEYVASTDFEPNQRLEVEELQGLIQEDTAENHTRCNIALNKPAFADSIKSAAYNAQMGNDGNGATYWSAADYEVGHYWQVDLEKEYRITGTKVVFRDEASYMYVIHTSLDGKNWTIASNQTGQVKPIKECSDQFTAMARYIRITYNSRVSGLRAGHYEFEVYAE